MFFNTTRKKHRKLRRLLCTPRSPHPGSAAGPARHYNLRLPTEGLRQGHGSPWQWPAPRIQGLPPMPPTPHVKWPADSKETVTERAEENSRKRHIIIIMHEIRGWDWVGLSQAAEVAPLEPLKEKKRAPVRRHKTWRNRAGTNAKREPLGNGSETAKRQLNPSSGTAKNGPSRAAEVAPLEPLKEKKRAPGRRQKTWRNRAGTNAKREPLGNGSETAKRHLNPRSGTAKNGHAQAAEVAPLKPLKEKKRAPVRRQKTWRNRAGTNAKREPLGNGSETAKHHLNPSSGTAKNGHAQAAEVAPLKPLKEKKRAPVRTQKRDATEPGQTQNGSLLAMDPKRPNAS